MFYRFGEWEVDASRSEIRHGSDVQRLQPKVLEVLQYLLEHPGQIVSVEELMAQVWNGRAIEPIGVARNIAQIRRAFGDDARQPQYIETVPKRATCSTRCTAVPRRARFRSPGCGATCAEARCWT